MPKPVDFVARANRCLETLEKGELEKILNSALKIADETLAKKGIRVFFEKDLGSYNMQLKVEWDRKSEHMDMVGMAALDEASIKSPEDLAQEIIQKAKQHIEARKTNGILFSCLGSKFDARSLEDHYVSIDQADYLMINNCRVALKVGNDKYSPLPASTFHSSTIIRMVNEGENIRLFDDLDLVRYDKRGMRINASKTHDLAIQQLMPRARDDAKDYKGKYYLLERDVHTPERIEHLYTVLSKIPNP